MKEYLTQNLNGNQLQAAFSKAALLWSTKEDGQLIDKVNSEALSPTQKIEAMRGFISEKLGDVVRLSSGDLRNFNEVEGLKGSKAPLTFPKKEELPFEQKVKTVESNINKYLADNGFDGFKVNKASIEKVFNPNNLDLSSKLITIKGDQTMEVTLPKDVLNKIANSMFSPSKGDQIKNYSSMSVDKANPDKGVPTASKEQRDLTR